MVADILARLAGLLAALGSTEQPTDGLQLVAAERPFEPNPTVPTVVYGLHDSAGWERVVATLRLTLPAGHPAWLLRADRPPVRETLDRPGDRAGEAEALVVPALAPEAAERSLQGLRYLVHRLRAPGGCPWDREQTHQSLTRHLLEETYEVLEAVEDLGTSGDEGFVHLEEELGDLLFEVVFHFTLVAE